MMMVEQYDVREYVKHNVLLMKFFGIWRDPKDVKLKNKLYFLIVNSITGSFSLSQAIFLGIAFQDLERMASSACVTITCSLSVVKAFFCLRYSPLLTDLYSQMSQEDFRPKNERQWVNTQKFMRYYSIARIALLVPTFGIMQPLWLLSPFLEKDIRLPSPAWYPYDWRKPLLYAISHFHQSLGVTFVSVVHILLDFLIVGCMALAAAECDILSDTVRNLREIAAEESGKSSEMNEDEVFRQMNRMLVGCVRHHWKIVKFSADCNDLFTVIIFAQFTSSLLTICMTNFQLSVLSPKSMEFSAVATYQIVMFVQLVIYCWFGNELIEKSSSISYAAYDSPWIECPQSLKKNILFLMLRTQRPIRMFALNFFILSLPTFTGILRTSWSFFAMLHQVHVKKMA